MIGADAIGTCRSRNNTPRSIAVCGAMTTTLR